jgi:hypothetical protein
LQLAVWQELKYSYWDTDRWPETGELRATDGIIFGNIIKKCWGGEYVSMDALQRDIQGVADEYSENDIDLNLLEIDAHTL